MQNSGRKQSKGKVAAKLQCRARNLPELFNTADIPCIFDRLGTKALTKPGNLRKGDWSLF